MPIKIKKLNMKTINKIIAEVTEEIVKSKNIKPKIKYMHIFIIETIMDKYLKNNKNIAPIGRVNISQKHQFFYIPRF